MTRETLDMFARLSVVLRRLLNEQSKTAIYQKNCISKILMLLIG